MAGISDQPFRTLCSELGAGLAISEMVTSDINLWQSKKSRNRLKYSHDATPRMVQIAGSCPEQMAEAARQAVVLGAEIVDINMGCPAKKVCKKAAGSALLKDEQLVGQILSAVVSAVEVPVTLKTRTGWCPKSRNAVRIARIAEDSGIAALTLHGRTRECRFLGSAEYDSIAEVVQNVRIPVIANGDINSAVKAETVLNHTQAAAVMIGRAARGNPWIFGQIKHYLRAGKLQSAPSAAEFWSTAKRHLILLHDFYGEVTGVRVARKHIGWYLENYLNITGLRSYQDKNDTQLDSLTKIKNTENRFQSETSALIFSSWRQKFNKINQREEQIDAVCDLHKRLQQLEDQAA